MIGQAAAGRNNVRLSPTAGIPPRNTSYELRARNGKLICFVSRERAEEGIADGRLESWRRRSHRRSSPNSMSGTPGTDGIS